MKIVKNFGQYLKENAIPATLDDMDMETQIQTEESPVVSEEEEDSFQGNSLMSELANALGTEVTNNEINYEGKRIIFPSETEMFHVDKKKFKTVQEVVDYLGVNAEPMGSPAPEMGAPHEPTGMIEEEDEEEEPKSNRYIDDFDDFEDEDGFDDFDDEAEFDDEFPKDDYRISSDDIGKLYDDEEDFTFKEDEESNGPFEDEEGGNEDEESTLEDEDEETFIGNNMDVCQDCYCDPCECDDCPACDETEDFGADLINRNESRITKKFKDFK